jgi:hypothetical protein
MSYGASNKAHALQFKKLTVSQAEAVTTSARGRAGAAIARSHFCIRGVLFWHEGCGVLA